MNTLHYISGITVEVDLFDEAIALIKTYEGWHNSSHHPYVGYGHRLTFKDKFDADISKKFADSLLRDDLSKKCAVFRRYGKDSLLLGVLAYNVGEYNLLGYGNRSKSRLIKKLDVNDRDIKLQYMAYQKHKGRNVLSLKKRREAEYELLFDKTKLLYNLNKFISND